MGLRYKSPEKCSCSSMIHLSTERCGEKPSSFSTMGPNTFDFSSFFISWRFYTLLPWIRLNITERAIFPTFWKLNCSAKSLCVFWVNDFKLWLHVFFFISFNFAKFHQDWTTLILCIFHMFFDFAIYQKFKGGTLIKCLISMFFNLTETLHS